MNIPFDLLLDTTGLVCPEPVMMLHSAVRGLGAGKVIKVVATDPSTTRDIPRFCGFLGHELLAQEQLEQSYCYFIRCG
ncbi:MAG: sulfurtransferase TusA [Gammaproteobacteria bacterium]|nr:MAG: sulfurtransferase TusA [Gammaproteobacteria bacterium]RLA53379.1 MAG: sulfurtransferase TusA [Gammaproteobacteria bacterium]